jgi:CBS domain-containing protein
MAEAMTQFQVGSEQHLSEFDEAYDDEKQIRGAIFSEPLSKVPQRPLVTVSVNASISQAIQAMNEKHVGCALVVRDGKLAGIFTERDVLTRVYGKNLALDAPVMRVMTEDPDTLPDSASIAYALRRMSVEGYRHVPLVDAQQRPTGVVSVRDIVAWICDLFPASVLNIPPQPETPKTIDGG